MARGSDVDENGNPIDPDDPTNPNPGGTPPPPANQPTTKGLEYWFAQGFSAEDIFDYESGQLKKGWTRTADGYDHDGTVTPGSWKNAAAPPPKAPSAPPPPGPGILDPFTEPFTPPARQEYPGAPTFTPPAFPTIPKWQAPTAEEALNSPGYQFRTQQGNQGLQNWAAARGTLNDSSTAKALTDYNQNAASQEYQNVWSRDYQGYQSDVKTQFLDPYEAAFQGWSTGTVAPGLAEWQTQMGATQHDNDTAYANYYNKWLQDYNIFDAQRKFTDNTKFRWATA